MAQPNQGNQQSGDRDMPRDQNQGGSHRNNPSQANNPHKAATSATAIHRTVARIQAATAAARGERIARLRGADRSNGSPFFDRKNASCDENR